MSHGSDRPIDVLRSYWAKRVAAACEYGDTRQQLLTWIEDIPAASLPSEVPMLRAAVADARTASTALDYLAHHVLNRAPEGRLPVRIRAKLIGKIARAELTEAPFLALLEQLLAADEDALPGLESELLAPSEAPSLAGVHSVLAHALRAVPHALWPTPPYHGGAARPEIGARNYEVAARSLAAVVQDPELRARLLSAADKERTADTRRPDVAGASLRPHVKAVARALAERETGCTEFLTAVDDELQRLDTVHALSRYRKQASAPIVRTLWRGMMGKRVVAWIAELSDGVHGLLCRLPFHYQWIEGSRDDVLATVPGNHFEEAVGAVLDG